VALRKAGEQAFGDGEAKAAVVRIPAGQMIRLGGESLAANGHYEIEPDEGQPLIAR
jgi:hypothetical protein